MERKSFSNNNLLKGLFDIIRYVFSYINILILSFSASSSGIGIKISLSFIPNIKYYLSLSIVIYYNKQSVEL